MDSCSSTQLNGVAESSAGSMELEASSLDRVQAALSVRRAHDLLLGGAVGCSEAAGPAILVHSGPLHCNRQQSVIIPLHL